MDLDIRAGGEVGLVWLFRRDRWCRLYVDQRRLGAKSARISNGDKE